MSKSKDEYFNFVHVLRGLASLIVVWSHLVGWWLPVNQATSNLQGYWENLIVRPFHLYQNGGHLGVLIFFLISGYIVAHVSLKENSSRFLLKRFFRIFPALFIVLIISYIIATFSLRTNLSIPLGNNATELKDYLYSLFLLDYPLGTPSALAVTWTLFVEILFYLLTAIFIKSTKKDPLKATWYFIIAINIIIILSSINPIINRIAHYAVYLFFVLLGRIIYLCEKKYIPLFESIILGIVSLFCYILFYDYLYPNSLFNESSHIIYTIIMAIIVFFIFKIFYNKKYKITTFLGDISYSLYLIHLPVGTLVLNILHKNGIPFKYSFLISCTICFIVSFLIYKFIEKPSQKIAHKLINISIFKNK
ncbi:acyltransferase family protein [Lachnoclostridium phytofermentans]|uniref:Acyltransferase 3 n=1 Tax=Lachnoclostridium phytofermentans (strain ATCC 700394 / DSM 18823 / ISDg) TaxID=357809 RepID=A9KHZ7_LACP7|nr:acyltransferase [Lachnoclostridium phytofermentans]ABX43844.1 acyltransferase 3 [Lachnoclostridium phytofermentans ISDg]